MLNKIIILGGGTAGWMAANILAKRWADKNIIITLLESSSIGIVGVGEGSTPQLKSFFDYMEIAESEWMPVCNATYKTGIRFNQWSVKPGFESYFHPFPAQPDDYSVPAFFYNSYVRRKGIDVAAHPDDFFLSRYLADEYLAPKAEHNFPFQVGYGYHFDSTLVGKFLKNKAITLGVNYVDARVQNVSLADDGSIESIQLDDSSSLSADFFVDCSGFSGVLIQSALKVDFVTYKNNLFNDRAVVIPSQQVEKIKPQTVSTALTHGWMWNIPLINRVGNGYVYASDFCSADAAETELRQQLGLLDTDVQARHLHMKVGRVAEHWCKNCLAVGLSQGFIEPLEATALHLVQETILGFAEAMDEGDFTPKHRMHFNQKINQRFDAVRDYIVCHYVVSSRNDSDYWRANTSHNQVSDSLRSLLGVWMAGDNLTQEVERQAIGEYYPSASWHCLLSGYGVFPSADQLKPGNEAAHKYKLDDIRDFIRRCGLNFKPHAEQLAGLKAASK